MSSRVGIVIPTFDAERHLARTLDSVLAQTHADWRCVIVDDGSADRTAEIADAHAARDARFRVVRRAHGGVSAARQTGVAALDADDDVAHLIFLDADDVWVPWALDRLIWAIGRPGDDGRPPRAVHAVASFIDEQGRPLRSPQLERRLTRLELRDGRIVEARPGEPTTTAMLATWPCVLTPGLVLIRRSAWGQFGDWDTRLTIGEDWELWYRLSLAGPLTFLDERLLAYRVHARSAQGTWRRPFRLEAARAKIRNAERSTPEQRTYARRASRAMARRLAFDRFGTGYGEVVRGQLRAGGKLLLGGSINLVMSVRPM